MPAPERITVDSGSEEFLSWMWRFLAGGAVRKRLSAAMAPGSVFAFRGIIEGAGRGPV